MSQKWKLVPVEPTQPMLDGMTTERKKGNGVLQMWFEAIAAAPAPPTNFIACKVDESCGGETVPPAGGEVLGSFGSHAEDGMEVFNVHIGEGQSTAMVNRVHVTAAHERIKELEKVVRDAATFADTNGYGITADYFRAALSKGEPK